MEASKSLLIVEPDVSQLFKDDEPKASRAVHRQRLDWTPGLHSGRGRPTITGPRERERGEGGGGGKGEREGEREMRERERGRERDRYTYIHTYYYPYELYVFCVAVSSFFGNIVVATLMPIKLF